MSILAKLIKFCRPHLRCLREPPAAGFAPEGELVRRMDIAWEATELKAEIARLRKNKKKFSHLEPRLIELRSELLKMDNLNANQT